MVSPVGDVATITFDWNATPLTVSYGSDPKNGTFTSTISSRILIDPVVAATFGSGGQVTLNYCGSD